MMRSQKIENRVCDGYQQNVQYYEFWRDEDWARRARKGKWSLVEKLEGWSLKVEENKIRGIRKKQVEPKQGGVRNEKEKMWASGQRSESPVAQSVLEPGLVFKPLGFCYSYTRDYPLSLSHTSYCSSWDWSTLKSLSVIREKAHLLHSIPDICPVGLREVRQSEQDIPGVPRTSAQLDISFWSHRLKAATCWPGKLYFMIFFAAKFLCGAGQIFETYLVRDGDWLGAPRIKHVWVEISGLTWRSAEFSQL